MGTRETRSGESNILELIFTNNHDLITNVQVQPSEITDHKYIVCETSHKLSTKGKEHIPVDEVNLSSYNYETADWVNIKASLKKINWPDVLDKCKSSEEKLKVIVDIVIKIVEIHCSIIESKGETPSHIIPRHRRILLRKKKKLYNKLRNTNSADKKVELENYIKEIDKKLLESHEEENIVKETQALEKIKKNPKHFFTYAKKKLKSRSKVGPFELNGEKIDKLVDICIKLEEQYTSSFSHSDPKFKIQNPREFFSTDDKKTGPELCDVNFTQKCISEAIGKVKNNAAAGTDRFPATLLKECADELSEPLYILWRYSLDNGEIAPMLKTAVICPILKPGSQRNYSKSYRPVSLTSHIIKVFGRVIRTALIEYLSDNDLLPRDQHAYIKGR